MIIRCVYDIYVEEDQYLDKINWKDVGEIVCTSLEHVAMKKYDIVTEKVERVGEHHHDARRNNCNDEYQLAEDRKG